MCAGVLLRRLLGDKSLSGTTHVIIDEVRSPLIFSLNSVVSSSDLTVCSIVRGKRHV